MSGSSVEPSRLVVNEHGPVPEVFGDGPAVALAQVRQQAVELLVGLDRQPRHLHIEAGTISIDITWDEGAVVPVRSSTVDALPSAGETRTTYLRSPAVGVFYHAKEPGAAAFVSVGSEVRPGQQIGIVEAMKLMIPVEADRAGRITTVIKGNGEPVEYDEPLFALDAGES